MDCDQHTVVMYFDGTIESNKTVFFDIPVPEDLIQAEQGTKRLTVTLVHHPNVQRWGLEEYLGTIMKWRMFRGDLTRDEVIDAMSASEAEEDTDEEEDEDGPKELKFELGVSRRSRGCVQHDIYEWKRHLAHHSSNSYTFAITSQERWGRNSPDPIPYAVVIRLEETSGTAPIYAAVSNALTTARAVVTAGQRA
jgi:hypothetical protein